uniref:Uncharacterized protein n=1 Tax=Pavo cristatus TaxID=9049 RepID=A0A8C9G527_PAVCR
NTFPNVSVSCYFASCRPSHPALSRQHLWQMPGVTKGSSEAEECPVWLVRGPSLDTLKPLGMKGDLFSGSSQDSFY